MNIKLVVIGETNNKNLKVLIDHYTHKLNHNTLSEYTITKPHISFWNLSKYDTAQLPCSSNQYDTKLISGYSSHLISHLHNRNKYVSYNPYTTIYDILNKYQYQVLENYVRSVVYM